MTRLVAVHEICGTRARRLRPVRVQMDVDFPVAASGHGIVTCLITNNDQGPQGLSASCHGVSHTSPISGSRCKVDCVCKHTVRLDADHQAVLSHRTQRGSALGSCPRFLQPHPLVCSSHESWLGKRRPLAAMPA
jgi:hypothetical protein